MVEVAQVESGLFHGLASRMEIFSTSRNIVLSDFCMDESEVGTIAILIVSLDAVAAHPNSPFGCKMCFVLFQKLENSAI
jgi:hypothetical protein